MAKLSEYEALCTVDKCRWCATKLPKEIRFYQHADGYAVDTFEHPQWLYKTCVACGYDWSLWKLGVPRHDTQRKTVD